MFQASSVEREPLTCVLDFPSKFLLSLLRVIVVRIEYLTDEPLVLSACTAGSQATSNPYHAVQVMLHTEQSSYGAIPCRQARNFESRGFVRIYPNTANCL